MAAHGATLSLGIPRHLPNPLTHPIYYSSCLMMSATPISVAMALKSRHLVWMLLLAPACVTAISMSLRCVLLPGPLCSQAVTRMRSAWVQSLNGQPVFPVIKVELRHKPPPSHKCCCLMTMAPMLLASGIWPIWGTTPQEALASIGHWARDSIAGMDFSVVSSTIGILIYTKTTTQCNGSRARVTTLPKT